MATDPTSLFTIDGTVIDPDGSATAGVRVVAADVIDATQPRPRVLVSATTDADGRFSLVLSAEDALRLFRNRSADDLWRAQGRSGSLETGRSRWMPSLTPPPFAI